MQQRGSSPELTDNERDALANKAGKALAKNGKCLTMVGDDGFLDGSLSG